MPAVRSSALGRLADWLSAWRCWRPGGIEDHRSFESGVVSYTRAGCPARAERRVDGLAEDHHVAGAVGGMARDAGGPLPDRHRPGPDRRRRHLPALVHMLFLPRHFPGRRPDVAVSARRSPGLLAARPPARQLRGLFRVPGTRLRPGHHSHAVLVGPARRVPGRGLVLGVRSATARRDQPRQVRRGTRRAVGRCPVRDRPRRRPRRPDRSRGGGQAVAGHPAGRDGSRPAAPRCGCGSGRAGRGRRHLRQRNGELPGAPERPRRRDRIGRSDPVHDLAASWLAWDGGVPVRRLAAQRGTRRARGGCVPPGPRPRSGCGDRLAAGDRRRPRTVAAGVRGRRAAGRDLAVPRGQSGAQRAVPALGHRPRRGVPGHGPDDAAPGRARRAGRHRAHAADLPDRVAPPAARIDAVTGVLAARNVLLAVAAALSCWRIVSAISPGHEAPSPRRPRAARQARGPGGRQTRAASS